MIEPKFAILDEIDSGLDIDALEAVSTGINNIRGDNFGAIVITHYQRLLNFVVPDFVHIVMNGQVVKSGNANLAKRLEREGYKGIADELGLNVAMEE